MIENISSDTISFIYLYPYCQNLLKKNKQNSYHNFVLTEKGPYSIVKSKGGQCQGRAEDCF